MFHSHMLYTKHQGSSSHHWATSVNNHAPLTYAEYIKAAGPTTELINQLGTQVIKNVIWPKSTTSLQAWK